MSMQHPARLCGRLVFGSSSLTSSSAAQQSPDGDAWGAAFRVGRSWRRFLGDEFTQAEIDPALVGETRSTAYPNGSFSSYVTATLTITKTVTGAFNESIKFTASGTNTSNNTVGVGNLTYNLSGTLVLCGGEAAAAIANAHLHSMTDAARAACYANTATNPKKTNGHGVLISSIAHEYKGQGSSVNEAAVKADVNTLCAGGTLT